MERYYRLKSPLSDQTYLLKSDLDWESAVGYYGDRLVGEAYKDGMLKRCHVASTVKANIDKLLLSMNDNNVEQVTHEVNKLHQAALPDYRVYPISMGQMHLDTYNNIIIPFLYPEENCEVCESPMLREIFPDLFFQLTDMKSKMQSDPVQVGHDPKPSDGQIMPEIVKIVGGKQVVDETALNERSRNSAFHRGNRPDPVIAKRVDEFSKALEPQLVITPAEGGISIQLPNSGLVIRFMQPKAKDELNQNIEPLPQKSAYDLWLEDGNVGTITEYLLEATRVMLTNRDPDYKETVTYQHTANGSCMVTRKSNQGDYSFYTYAAGSKPSIDLNSLPEIKGVVLKGSKPPVEIDDREVRSHIKNFVETQYEPHLAAQVLEKLDTIAEVEKKPLVDILPPHLTRIIDALKFGKGHIEAAIAMMKDIQSNKPTVEDREEQVEVGTASTVPSLTEYGAVLEQLTWEAERRILIGTNSYGIQEQFLRFLKRCDEEQLNTTTPSAYTREHFDQIYKTNRDTIGYMLATVLAPHLENAAHRREYMVDGTENNVLRVSRKCLGRNGESYRQLVTIRFVKGFFNIEMH